VSTVIALIVACAQAAACAGLGAAALTALGLRGRVGRTEALPVAFVLGMGVLGFLVFPLGVIGALGAWPLGLLLVAGIAGCTVLRLPSRPAPPTHAGGWLVLLTVVAVLGFGAIVALAPPTDADTLAYHFALPRQFLQDNAIEFVPRAIDGAAPLLVQMTYLPVLRLGGEQALTLWTWLTSLGVAALLYALARRHLDRGWSLAIAAVFLTAPAVIYGGGSGQVEVRNCGFVLLAAYGLSRAVDEDAPRFSLLAGAGAGFFAATKYLGLLFVAACGPSLLLRRGGVRLAIAFGLAVAVIGHQWYAWNAWHIGDPVFPMLWDWLGRPGDGLWTAAHQRHFLDHLSDAELAVPRTPWWLLAYPIEATLDGPPIFASGRTGLGPYLWLLVPFALWSAWRFRHRLVVSPLHHWLALALLFYALWFFTGSSQRVRHLLPVLPLALVFVTVAAKRLANAVRARAALVLALALTLSVQTAGAGVFASAPARFVFSNESREAYLLRTVARFEPVPWINANLGADSRLLVTERQILYYLDVPYFSAPWDLQALIDLLPGHADPVRFLSQAKALGITHLLVWPPESGDPSGLSETITALGNAGCLDLVRTFTVRKARSRTLPGLGASTKTRLLYRLDYARCPSRGPA